jgi:SAM-dependent methyltransferase
MMKKLDIGCGRNKLEGSVGLDVVALDGVDVVHDLNCFPYPFPENTFDYVRVIHVIEHLQSIIKTMAEIHRIAKPDAEVDIVTPHHTDSSSWQDPTQDQLLFGSSLQNCLGGNSTVEALQSARLRVSRELKESSLQVHPKILGAVSVLPRARQSDELSAQGYQIASSWLVLTVAAPRARFL